MYQSLRRAERFDESRLARSLAGLLAAALLSAFFTPAGAAEMLETYTAEYAIRISVLRGSLQTSLIASVDGYQARSEISPVGLARLFSSGSIVEQSVFQLTERGVRPTSYTSHDTFSKSEEHVVVEFDWNASAVAGTVNDEPYAARLDGTINDRVSIQYALMWDLLNGGIRDRYTLFDVDRVKTLQVRQLEQTSVDVPYGTFDAIPVQHQTQDSSRVTTLWCAPQLGYLPVIIEQRKDGKRIAYAVLKSHTAGQPATAD